MMNSERLMFIYIIISRESVREKISHRKYVRDQSSHKLMTQKKLNFSDIVRKKRTIFWKDTMNSARLMFISIIISKENVGEKIPRQKYKRNLNNI